MDIVQQKQQEFNEFFENLLQRIDNKPDTLFGSTDLLFNETEVCSSKGDALKGKYPVIASEYYFSGAMLCLWYLDHYEIVDPVLRRGETMIGKARTLLPEDGEYHLVEIYFKILGLGGADPVRDYESLKQLHQECPSFKLVTGSLMKKEWLEDTYNRFFEGRLSGLIDALPTDDLSMIEEAVEMLKSFPGTDSKLKAYSYLASLDFAQNKLDESLRVAKLGVELLGTTFEFDRKNPLHELWATCWTLVGRINRAKGEYDFAMSVFEKGQMLGIVPCIKQLAEMYKNGEGEDADIAESERLLALANSIEEKRLQEEREEQERLRIEEEKRQEEIRRKEEEFRIAEEMKARHREIVIRKSLLIAGIVATLVSIVWCIANLRTENLLDRIAKYEKEQYAILDARMSEDSPYVIVMNKKGIFLDNMRSSTKVLTVGDTIKTEVRKCELGSNGLTISVLESEPLRITSSNGLFFKRLTDQSFLITKSRINAPFSSKVDVSDAILVLTSKGEVVKAIRFNKGALDGAGNVATSISGDILPTYEKAFRQVFSAKQYSEIEKREYGKYSAAYRTSLKDGSWRFDDNVALPNLNLTVSPGELGRVGLRNQMETKIAAIFRQEFVKAMLEKATKLTGVSDNSKKRLSPDDRFTMVIATNYREGKNSTALLKINNQNNTVSVVDTGMEVEFRDRTIYVKKHSKFLFVFDSYKDIYYDYYGNQTN